MAGAQRSWQPKTRKMKIHHGSFQSKPGLCSATGQGSTRNSGTEDLGYCCKLKQLAVRGGRFSRKSGRLSKTSVSAFENVVSFTGNSRRTPVHFDGIEDFQDRL
jgi:hypothetical protein